tara:strand:+ start:2568 stop:3023 length:456 start_codon:yes stop_codon:yes gene_type:complete
VGGKSQDIAEDDLDNTRPDKIMAVVIKGIKLLSKTKMGRKTLSKIGKAISKKNRAREKAAVKSVDRYAIKAGAASQKGPVPIKKQSLQKSTLSGRTYSISNNKLSAKTMLDIGGGYGTTSTARFQDAVKDLIGLDKLSIRKAYKRGLRRKK